MSEVAEIAVVIVLVCFALACVAVAENEDD